jgi:hypothetical protein
MDPIARKLGKAIDDAENQRAVKSGEQMLEKDFALKASKEAQAEFEELADIFQKRAEKINASKPKGIPEFQYEPFNPAIRAGKYQLRLVPCKHFEWFELSVSVGLHPNAHQSTDDLPDLPTRTFRYYAACDDKGYFWFNMESNARCKPEDIAKLALEALSDLLEADLNR